MDNSARARATPLILGALGLAIALVLYLPWRARPFDLWDFPEFLPVLLRHSNTFAQFGALVEHYAHEGRFNVLPYAFLALKWDAFGWRSELWQTTRFVQMMLIVVGVYLVTRIFVRNPAAAALPAGLFITATTAATAWIRLTMAEPLALMFLLGAIALACRFQGTARPTLVAVGIASLLLGALLAKEMMVAAFPFVVLLAWCWRSEEGSIQTPRLSQRNRMLLLICTAALLPACIAIAAVALGASKQSFSSSYGSNPVTFEGYLVRFMAFIIPAWPGSRPSALTTPVNVSLLTVITMGWYATLRERDRRVSALRLLGLLILLPAVGALLYLPWPSFGAFYGLPFLLGTAILLAVALDTIARRLRPARYLAYGAGAFVILGTALQAYHTARGTTAKDEVNFALINRLAQYSSVDTVYVGSPVRPQDTWRLGARIARSQALFTPGRDLPPVRDIACGEFRDRERRLAGNLLLVSYAESCGPIDHPTIMLIRRYAYFDPASVSIQSDSFRVDLLAPERDRGAGSNEQTQAAWPPKFE